MLEDQENLRRIAMGILKRVNACKTCDVHGYEYVIDEGKLQDACKLGNSQISKGELLCDRKELMGAIKDVLDSTPEDCVGCLKESSDD